MIRFELIRCNAGLNTHALSSKRLRYWLFVWIKGSIEVLPITGRSQVTRRLFPHHYIKLWLWYLIMGSLWGDYQIMNDKHKHKRQLLPLNSKSMQVFLLRLNCSVYYYKYCVNGLRNCQDLLTLNFHTCHFNSEVVSCWTVNVTQLYNLPAH